MDDPRLIAASKWRLRREAPLSDREAAEFEDWRADHDNAVAYEQVDRAWAAFDDIDATTVQRLQRDTRARARRRKLIQFIAPIAAVLLVAVGAGTLWLGQLPRTYGNDGRVPLTVALSDGSRVTIDAQSSVKVDYSPRRRRVELRSGQATFEVARDASRPFEVRVDKASLTALGTTFNVNRWGDGATVALTEGRLRVKVADAPASTILTAGQKVSVQGGRLSQVSGVETLSALGWRHGLLVFSDDSLDEALARVNRYGGREVKVASPSLGALRISGTFRAGDTESFYKGVAELHHLRVTVRAEDIVLDKNG